MQSYLLRGRAGSIGATEVILGALFVLCGVYWFLSRRTAARSAAELPASTQESGSGSVAIIILLAIIAAGLVIRLTGLDAKGLSHPEIYVPGLDLPPGLSEPPPRHGFLETLKWHFLSESHPFGYYMAMWAWTKLVGATAVTIRIPEALAGALSIPVLYRVGTLVYSRRVGLIAATMLALHGFHIFWSQTARMYAPGAFFGLLATMLLLEMAARRDRSRWLEFGYVASFAACATTVEFAWAVLAVHLIWAALHPRQGKVLLPLIAAAAIVAMPMLSHAVLSARRNPAPKPTLAFLEQYFSFGFLLQHGAYPDAMPVPGPSSLLRVATFLASAILLAVGLMRTGKPLPDAAIPTRSRTSDLLPLALGASLIMLGFATLAEKHHKLMLAVLLIPWLALIIPMVGTRLEKWVQDAPARPGRQRATALMPMLAILPTIGIFVFSYIIALTAPRAFLIFVPYFLLLTAAGLDTMLRRTMAALPVGIGLFALFLASIGFAKAMPTSPRDYRGLADAIQAQIKPGDVVLIRAASWKYTPLAFYLRHDRLIGTWPDGAMPPDRAPCVWAVRLQGDLPPTTEDTPRLYRPAFRVTALRAEATRYCRRTGTA